MSEIAEALEKSRQYFKQTVSGIPENEAHTRLGPETWSVLDCVEHVVKVEDRFIGLLQSAQLQETPRIDKQREADLSHGVTDRTTRRTAPEIVHPGGRFASLAEALQEFDATRKRTIGLAEKRDADLYRLSVEHPRFGVLNGAELLLLIAGHSGRHADQIREIRSGVSS